MHDPNYAPKSLDALIKPGRIFRLCASCADARHESHEQPCECDDYNAANLIQQELPWYHEGQPHRVKLCFEAVP